MSAVLPEWPQQARLYSPCQNCQHTPGTQRTSPAHKGKRLRDLAPVTANPGTSTPQPQSPRRGWMVRERNRINPRVIRRCPLPPHCALNPGTISHTPFHWTHLAAMVGLGHQQHATHEVCGGHTLGAFALSGTEVRWRFSSRIRS